MWRDIRVKKLTGNVSLRQITQLRMNDSFTCDPLLLSEIWAQNSNYDTSLSYKIQTESSQISFDPLSGESQELSIAINTNLKNPYLGLDDIHAAMLENFHPDSPTYLLVLFNKIFSQKNYPIFWKTVIILSIFKPNSDPSLPASFQPIAISSFS